MSRQYFDKYRFEGDPRLLAAVVGALKDLIPIDTEVVAALELGGVPLVTMLSQLTGLPAVFVRKGSKVLRDATLG
jgi:orotate phosphoribosyltransferase